ncbi:MAG TPA: ABC transporter permease [Candidatus Margulisiibacteriota bacterium]|nr:ABC transporter permease [Candidatus Margulisiibacteriota bacterium]
MSTALAEQAPHGRSYTPRSEDGTVLQPLIIEPPRGWKPVSFSELWEYRELLYFLIWRDIKVRYKQTVLGGAWAILQPILTMAVFTLLFGRLAKMPSDGVPYPIFSYAALVPWTFFSNGLSKTTTCLVESGSILSKVYFPRLLIPLAKVLSGLVDFAMAFVVLVVMMLCYGMLPTLRTLWLPLFLLLAVVALLAVGLWFSVLNLRYRDIGQAIPFVMQFWLFVTPIAYPSSVLAQPWRTLYGLNPMTSVVEGFRWALLGSGAVELPVLAASVSVALLTLASGVFYFRRVEWAFADIH